MTLIFFAGPVLAAEPAAMNGVRVGEHRDYTRIVIDLSGQEAPYSVRLSDDGLSVVIVTKAAGSDGALAPKKTGLIHEVKWRGVTNGVVMTIGTANPVSVLGDGALAPDSTSRFFRIYVDLKAGQAATQNSSCNSALIVNSSSRSKAHLHAEPSDDARIIDTLEEGNVVYTCDDSHDFYQIFYPTREKACAGGGADGLPQDRRDDCNAGWIRKRYINILNG